MSTVREIAATILQQLGGNQFRIMTGARGLSTTSNGLTFKLPSRFAKDGINVVVVDLNALDLYDICFSKERGSTVVRVAEFFDVHAEDLRRLFTETTGLDTHL